MQEQGTSMREPNSEQMGKRAGARAIESYESLRRIAAEHNSFLPLGPDFAEDLRVHARFNALHYIALYAVSERGAEVDGPKPEALWIVPATPKKNPILLPESTPSGVVLDLASCTFHVVLYLKRHHEPYAHGLNHRLKPWSLMPPRYTGKVTLLPRRSERGEVLCPTEGKQHVNKLLRRDGNGLRMREQVEFSVAWDAGKKTSVAVLLTSPGQCRRLDAVPAELAFHVSAETAA
jgi:hypothetical protein